MSSPSSNPNDLDLSQIPSDDLDALAQEINRFYKSDTPVKVEQVKQWDKTHMMLDGKQWLQYEGANTPNAQWNTLSVNKSTEYIPRPTTNYLFDSYQTLKSYLIKNKPRSKVFPNDPNDYDDIISAQLSTLCCEANWKRLKEQYNYETAAAALVTYGTIFKKSYWDPSSVSLVKVPKMVPTPVTDPTTGMPTGEMSEVQETDPKTGDLLFDSVPLGDLNTCVVDPQRITLDRLAVNLHEIRWIMENSVQSIDWVKEVYGREGQGFTGKALELEPDKDVNGSMQRWLSLRNSTGTKSGSLSGMGSAGGDNLGDNSVIVKEVYERPSSQYPKGRLIVVAGNKCVFVDQSPYEGPELGDWHPYSECRWEILPGRFDGKGPLDNALEIQRRINSIDSIISLTRKTTAIPQKLIPTTVGIAPGTWTGRPGGENYYRPDGTGAKPEIIPPTGVDASVFQERAQCVSDLKEITGAIDILRGDRPAGVNAASALSLLYEVGTGKLYPILDRWKSFVENDQRKQLLIIQKYYKEPREAYIKVLKSLNQDLPESEINLFLGRDIRENCNVVIEAGSNIPKLEAAKQALLLNLAQMQALNLANPSNLSQFHQDLGIAGYDSDIEPDKKRAMFENSVLDNLDHGGKMPVVLAVDNHALHKLQHTNRMKSPAFLSLSPNIQKAYMLHVQEHDQFEAMAKEAMMHEQMALGAPPPAPAGPPQAPGFIKKAGGKQPAGGPTAETKNVIVGGPDIHNAATIGTH